MKLAAWLKVASESVLQLSFTALLESIPLCTKQPLWLLDSKDMVSFPPSKSWYHKKNRRRTTDDKRMLCSLDDHSHSRSPISWSSKKQTVVTLSTCEAEYIAACSTACRARWLSSLLGELKVYVGEAMELLVDNKPAIDLARNPVSHGRSKHIDTKFQFLRDQVSKGKIQLKHCRTELQLADIMTKSLKSERFKELREFFNVICL